jgi:hypothetical protein
MRFSGTWLFAACAVSASLQAERPAQIEISLEREVGNSWEQIHPGFILERGEAVRFRVRSNSAGWLYVVNQGSSGKKADLFAGDEVGTGRYIEANQEYTVPPEKAKLRITGPAGYETVNWILSSAPLSNYSGFTERPAAEETPARLLPRCDDTLLRARGECIDQSAGPRTAPTSGTEASPAARPNPVRVMRERDLSIISSEPVATSPVTYQFRIAHK